MSVLVASQADAVRLDRVRVDGGTQARAEIDLFTVQQYADDMQTGAVFPPIVVFHDGSEHWLADGFHRVEAARQAGFEEIAADVRQGTRRDAVLHSVGANFAHGLRRTNADKRRAVTMLMEDEEWGANADNWIAQKAAVTQPFVSKLRSTHNGYKSPVRKGQDGRIYDTSNIGRSQPAEGRQQPRALHARDDDPPAATPHVSHNSGNNEWYTPPEFIAAARTVMGGIDLDPASSAKANEFVQAPRYYTAEDDGLEQAWSGRVWLNPPYSGDLVGRFAAKTVQAIRDGDIDQAVVLVNNATETTWFQLLACHAASIALPKGRIRYLDETGEPKQSPLQGQAFLYFGPHVEHFQAVFSAFGVVL